MSRRLVAALAAGCLLLVGCGPTDAPGDPAPPADAAESADPTDTAHDDHGEGHGEGHDGTEPVEPAAAPLREGERRQRLQMPAAYTPSAPYGVGTDDYRCFLLDPGLTEDAFLTGTHVLPGNPDVVHHVIMFRVPPSGVEAAQATDDAEAGEGWTCFGDVSFGDEATNRLDDAQWLAAWAPGSGEAVAARGFGTRLEPGTRLVMQVHYNLLVGQQPDRSALQLRLAPADAGLDELHTVLLPAPVELPCRPGRDDAPLCDRKAAMADVRARFGDGPGSSNDFLQLLCGGVTRTGPVTRCARPVREPTTVRAAAGHMHLLGRSIRIVVNPRTPRARTVLDVPVWDFDDQGADPVRPVRLRPGDVLEVTCRHDQRLRDRLPAFETQREDRYVVWGEGSTDEMCLGILTVSRP